MKKKFILIYPLLILITGCFSHKGPSTEELKLKYGDFNGSSIKWLSVDYEKTPINKKILHHPEDFEYLDKVEIYSIAHISDGLFLTGFMVAPKAPGEFPCIVFNRGGNQDMGQLQLVGTVVEIMAPLAAKGYVVVGTNYRGNSGGEGKEQFGGDDVNDVRNLIKSLSEFEKANTEKIGLLGISRGGMMNYLTLKSEPGLNIKAIVNIGGITDMNETIKHHHQIEDVAIELIPDFHQNRETELEKRSAVYWADELPKDVPILILHSKEDQHVSYSQIPSFADSLLAYGVPHKLVSFEDDNHGLLNPREIVKELVLTWFDDYVKNARPFEEGNIRETVE